MVHGDFKDLPRRVASNKILHNKAFNIAKNPIYDGYHCGLTSMVYECFDKKASAMCANELAGGATKSSYVKSTNS